MGATLKVEKEHRCFLQVFPLFGSKTSGTEVAPKMGQAPQVPDLVGY